MDFAAIGVGEAWKSSVGLGISSKLAEGEEKADFLFFCVGFSCGRFRTVVMTSLALVDGVSTLEPFEQLDRFPDAFLTFDSSFGASVVVGLLKLALAAVLDSFAFTNSFSKAPFFAPWTSKSFPKTSFLSLIGVEQALIVPELSKIRCSSLDENSSSHSNSPRLLFFNAFLFSKIWRFRLLLYPKS